MTDSPQYHYLGGEFPERSPPLSNQARDGAEPLGPVLRRRTPIRPTGVPAALGAAFDRRRAFERAVDAEWSESPPAGEAPSGAAIDFFGRVLYSRALPTPPNALGVPQRRAESP